MTGAVTIQPTGSTVYAGVPFTFTIQGGRTPYALTSSEPGLMPVPATVDGHTFTVVAANPGVIDVGITAGELPVKTVTISVRSGDGIQTSAAVKVGQNFLTGYGVSFSPITCPINNPPSTVQACGGGETTVTMQATFNGNLAGDRQFQFQVLKGHFGFVFPQTGVVGNTVTTVSDHSGVVTVIIAMDANAPTEIAVLRVIDLATGVYDDHAFVITGKAAGNGGKLTALPNGFTFTGNQTTDCGGGSGTFQVFDGTAPFTAISSNPRIQLSNTTSNANPGTFTFSLGASNLPCATGSIIVTDSSGANVEVTVNSLPGTGTPPTPAAFTVAPNALTLGCGQSGSVSVVGGSGNYFTNSTSTNVTAIVSGNTVTITRLNSGTNPTATTTVTVSDGTNIGPVTVTSPLTCP